MNRRNFLKTSAFLSGGLCLNGELTGPHAEESVLARARLKLGVVSDGLSQDFEAALRIMRGYGLSWVEIRHVWGKYNTELAPDEIGRIRELMDQYGFKCSVVDSALYKCLLPNTHSVVNQADPYPYSGQMDLLKRAMDRAHAWGSDKVRGFTFWRVREPERTWPRISEELAKAAEVANRGGVRLVIENEFACNAGTAKELSAILKTSPSAALGINWDIGSGYWLGEPSYPDGYNTLDKRRVWHMHLKGVECNPGFVSCRETFPDEGQIDLTGQLRSLLRDGYRETLSLECEFSAPHMSALETTSRSIEGLLRVANRALT